MWPMGVVNGFAYKGIGSCIAVTEHGVWAGVNGQCGVFTRGQGVEVSVTEKGGRYGNSFFPGRGKWPWHQPLNDIGTLKVRVKVSVCECVSKGESN